MWIKRVLYLSLLLGAIASAGLIFISLMLRSPQLDTVGIVPKELSNNISPLEGMNPIPPSVSPALPKQKILPGGVQVFQTFNNCGPAALSMTLSHYGIYLSQRQLGQELRPYQQARGDNDDKSVTLDEIEAKAKEYGFIVYHRPAASMELVKQFIAQDIPVLTRTWLKPNEDIGHFRVIKGYDETTRELIQDDSLQGGNLRYSYEEFDELWRAFNYEFVVLIPKEKKGIAEHILGPELLSEESAWQKGINIADSMLEKNPDDTYALFNKSVALYHMKEYQKAIEQYELVESRLPSRMLWYQIEPILAYWKVGNYQKVFNLSDHILSNNNRAYSELYYLKAIIYQQQGNQELADEMFSQADLYNPTGSWKANLIGITN